MSKTKMRCAHCGTPFKSSDHRQTLCKNCLDKERLARAQRSTNGASAPTVVAKTVTPPKVVGPGARLIDPNAPVDSAPSPVLPGAHGKDASPARKPVGHAQSASGHAGEAVRGEDKQSQQHGARPSQAQRPATKVATPRPPKKARAEPTPRFILTDELRDQIEQRYLALAHPVEFDGIRTKIAEELAVPKAEVRKVVLDLRRRLHLLSWWEVKGFAGSGEDLAHIKALYMPHLPVPPVGVHLQLAQELQLDPVDVYRAIKRIRAEMRLPQFNPPSAHPSAEETPAPGPLP